MGGAAQPVDALNGQRRSAFAVNLGAHGAQASGEINDLRLARCVFQHRRPFGQRRRHQQVFRGADRDIREVDVRAL